MKKLLFIGCVFSLSVHYCQAQTFAEWFEQKKTELKYYATQISALYAVKTDIENGINIAQQGLDFITAMKKGELNLHTAFFNSLEAINPAIAKYSKVGGIISYQLAIILNWNRAMSAIRASNRFSSGEISYLNAVFSNMMSESSKTIDELTNLLTSNVYQMKDDERIRRVDGIYTDMQSKYAFTQSFTSGTALLLSERVSETGEVNTLEQLHGLK